MDFEASGAEEWALPGYGRPSPQKNPSETEALHVQNIASQAEPTPKAEHVRQASVTSKNKNTTVHYPAPARGTAGAYRGRGASRGKRGSSSPRTHLPGETPSKSQWRNGIQPSGTIKLSHPFREIRDTFCTVARSVSHRRPFGQQGRHDVFDDICRKTGAYINPPAGNHDVIHLWGASYQVSEATKLIQSILARCDTLTMPKKREWTKTSAFSVGKEDLADQLELEDALILAYRKAPELEFMFSEKLLFLWPKEGPSMRDALGTDLEALDPVRIRFTCHLFVDNKLPDHICALGYDQAKTGLLVQLLRNKWAEILAKSLVKSKIYLVEPLESGHGEVSARKEAGFVRPLFRKIPMSKADLDSWPGRAELIRSRNNAHLLKVIDKCLKSVVYVRGHLRMRANIGLFVLDYYRQPSQGKPAWGFEEFREMLFHENTKGRLIPGLKINQSVLLPRLLSATSLLEPYDRSLDSLRQPEPAFSVNFEFSGQKNSLLRLEAEFAKCPGARDYAMTQSRWLKPRKIGQVKDSRSHLQVGIIDFERSDWQLEIASLEFYEATAIERALREFSHTIKFKSNDVMGDISANPVRKVIFHASAPVSRFIEKTAIRYRLKGTRYILEIARYDEYTRTSTTDSASLNFAAPFGKPRVSWGASVFDFTWDNLLGKHANMPVGHAANYDPNLQTFFPAANESEDKSQGLWEFIDLIKRVAALLRSGPLRAMSATGSVKAKADGRSASPASSGNARALDADLGTLF
ncbi:hypothetical protein BO82DRAFT_427994 [Aspergillus uvarum CBS 121591]|uniref:DUF7905 domain-containing protein n=1 Tax=Aspergillus uvarum CBS 121591 TaxID=1448315 RepID=A0A319CP65_9EURO|nr:hypothetical protein BO82DRAFT_427994 [Aspergillus uvarum CBS 121591]PYH87236.1 hypothetical protein BO82DRAFT_427994 [Aspergillus uvarum CBS 121591]